MIKFVSKIFSIKKIFTEKIGNFYFFKKISKIFILLYK